MTESKIDNSLILCKALSKMHTDNFYIPQWDEIQEKIYFIESKFPKCTDLNTTLSYYSNYELPEDAELIVLGFQRIA